MKLLANNLAATRDGQTIFKNLSFNLSSGQALIIKGNNGAGKSTLLEIICGLLPATRGKISLVDTMPEYCDIDLSEIIHYLGHKNAMKSNMSVIENLVFWRDFFRKSHPGMNKNHVDISVVLKNLGLERLGNVRFGHLSAGQRRRAAFSKLLVSYRPLWVLDEPNCGLDSHSRQKLVCVMQKHLDGKGMIIVTTHMPLALEPAKSIEMKRHSLHARYTKHICS